MRTERKSTSDAAIVVERQQPSMGKTMRRLRVKDLMTDRVLTLHPMNTLAALRDLMQVHHVRHVPVVNAEREIVGLVTHRDLVRNVLVDPDMPVSLERELMRHTTIEQVMMTGVETIDPDADIAEAAQIMLENKYGCLPVVEGLTLIGILTEADFVRYVADTSGKA